MLTLQKIADDKYEILSTRLTYKQFLQKGSIIEFIGLLKRIPFEYYMLFFGFYPKRQNERFRVIAKESSDLLRDVEVDTKTYKKYFNNDDDVAVFWGLHAKTKLIVPKISNRYPIGTYKNIGTYTQGVDIDEQRLFWRRVFRETLICDDENWYLWIHGRGIGHLHVRLDLVPKNMA